MITSLLKLFIVPARYLMKSFANAASGDQLTWSVKYLSAEPRVPQFRSAQDLLDFAKLTQACERRAYL